MKKKWAIFILFTLTTLALVIGCRHRELTKEEVYKNFQEEILKISSYTCTAEIETRINKKIEKYVLIHSYKKPDHYKIEVISPNNLKGKTMEYKGNSIIIKNPKVNDSVKIDNVGENNQYMFIGEFLKNYLQNEHIDISLSNNHLKLKTNIPGENSYYSSQVLYINEKSKKPEKMEILDKEDNIKIIVNYRDFTYKK